MIVIGIDNDDDDDDDNNDNLFVVDVIKFVYTASSVLLLRFLKPVLVF